jgi:thioredoxin 1
MSKFVSEVNDGAFEREVLGSEVPVVVDFWAPWCPPCRALEPTVEALAESYGGAVRFYKLNIDENQTVPQRYGIRSIPTLILFSGGREAERVVGAASREALARVFDKYAQPVGA